MNARLLAAEARHYPHNPRTRALSHIGATLTTLARIKDLPPIANNPADWATVIEAGDVARWFADDFNGPWPWERFDADMEWYCDRSAAGLHAHPRRAAKTLAPAYEMIRIIVADDESEDAAHRYLSGL